MDYFFFDEVLTNVWNKHQRLSFFVFSCHLARFFSPHQVLRDRLSLLLKCGYLQQRWSFMLLTQIDWRALFIFYYFLKTEVITWLFYVLLIFLYFPAFTICFEDCCRDTHSTLCKVSTHWELDLTSHENSHWHSSF